MMELAGGARLFYSATAPSWLWLAEAVAQLGGILPPIMPAATLPSLPRQDSQTLWDRPAAQTAVLGGLRERMDVVYTPVTYANLR
jgi:hypothetical protein